jgi:hypothetical protein
MSEYLILAMHSILLSVSSATSVDEPWLGGRRFCAEDVMSPAISDEMATRFGPTLRPLIFAAPG